MTLRKTITAVALAIIVSATAVLAAEPAHAAFHCPASSKGGKAIGSIDVGNTHVALKRVHMNARGALNPPATNKVAAWASDWQELDATEGTTVITWHVRYGVGCPGKLNPVLDLPVGGTFTVTNNGGATITYRISQRMTVKKGNYRESWFDPEGPHRLLLLTCGGLKNGKFRKTVAVFADEISR